MTISVYQNQRIHFRIEGERGPYLVLATPAVSNIDVWYRQGYVQHLEEHFRLVLINTLGQGRSDAPESPEFYGVPSKVSQIFQVVNDLNIDNFHFYGSGLGGQIGFELAARHAQRLRSVCISNAHPYPVSTESEKLEKRVHILRSKGIENYLKELDPHEFSSELAAELSQGSAEAYAESLSQVYKWQGVTDRLRKMRTSMLLLTGTSEEKFLSIREAGRSIGSARYLILPQLEYGESLLKGELVAPHLIDFMKKPRSTEPNRSRSNSRAPHKGEV